MIESPQQDFRKEAYPVGAIIIRRKGKCRVRYVKLTHRGPNQKRWKSLARHWWEKNKGVVPVGMRVTHLDGNTLNDDPANYGLVTPGQMIKTLHRLRPEMSMRNIAAASAATATCNRQRGAIRRARQWLPTQWYIVDPARRVILNQPRRKLWKAAAEAGIEIGRDRWARRRLRRHHGLVALRGRDLQNEQFKHFEKVDSLSIREAA